GRQEEGGLLSEQRGDALLEPVDGRIVEALLVAHLGLRHRAAHLGRGPRLRVAEEVDGVHSAYARPFPSSASWTTASRPSSRTRSGNRPSTRSRAAPRA